MMPGKPGHPTRRDLYLCLAAVLLLLPLLAAISPLAFHDQLTWSPPWSSGFGDAPWTLAGQGLWGLLLGFSGLAGSLALYPRLPRALQAPALFVGLAAGLTWANGLAAEPSGVAWLVQVVALLPGMGLAALFLPRHQLSRPLNPKAVNLLWNASLAMAWLLVLMPAFSADAVRSLDVAGGVTGYPADVAQRTYQLIKATLPGLPVGLVLALAVSLPMARMGVVCFVLGYLGGSLVFPMGTEWKQALDIFFVVPGLALGLWMGGRLPRLGPIASQAASRPEPSGSAPPRKPPPESARRAVPPLPQGQAEPVPRPGSRRARGHGSGARGEGGAPSPARATLGGRLLGLALLLLAGVLLWDFPRWPGALALGLAAYLLVLWFRPTAWLLVVPAALPLLDFAPWTGRLFLDEFDLLMLATAGLLWLRGGQARPAPLLPGAALLIGLFGLSALVSGFVGAWPLPPPDANAFASYWSPYNVLRVAKGFLWGGLFFLLLRGVALEREAWSRLLALGMALGLLGVGAVGAWEHSLFVGAPGGDETYRIVSTFSSMHTGGGHIEAYLVAAMPFLWLATSRLRHLLLTGPVMLLTAYVMLYTVARGGVLALGVVILVLAVASVRLAMRTRSHHFVAALGVLGLVGGILALGAGSGYLQQRFADTGRDWQIRVDHWGEALAMRDGTLAAQAFGMGLGSFPRVYQERGPADQQPASFGFAREGGNTFFRLGTGDTVYYAQRIPFSAGQRYRLEVDLRGVRGEAHLDVPVCEKQLLNSRKCEWHQLAAPGDGAWHRVAREVSSAQVGARDWLRRPPVELFLYNPAQRGVVDVDRLRLLDADGRDVLCNGDFSRGGDCWFFKTHSHLPWHIKNAWVHVLFEQGWLGLAAFAALVVTALYRLARAGWQGHRLAWAWLASLAGLLTVGLFDSLLDAPRLATLLLAGLAFGAAHAWAPRASVRRRPGPA